VQRVVVEVLVERRHAADRLGRVIADDAARPGDIFLERGVALADVVVDEQSRPDVVVADERVGPVLAPEPDDGARGLGRHQHRGDGVERARVFGERAVVRDDGRVEAQFERDRLRVAKPAAGDDGDLDPAPPRLTDGRAIPLRQLAPRVEQRPVEVERDQSDCHANDSVSRLYHPDRGGAKQPRRPALRLRPARARRAEKTSGRPAPCANLPPLTADRAPRLFSQTHARLTAFC
jgi:hypothetical protein